MALKLTQSEFEIERDIEKCISCQVCVRQCSNDVHYYDSEDDIIYSDNCSSIFITVSLQIWPYGNIG